MSLFRKKCEYSKMKIERGKEIFRMVKLPEFTVKKKKAFCCEEHADAYEKNLENKKCCGSGGCCG